MRGSMPSTVAIGLTTVSSNHRTDSSPPPVIGRSLDNDGPPTPVTQWTTAIITARRPLRCDRIA